MKRDLAFGLDVESQLADSLGVTQANPTESRASSYVEEADDSCKRIKVTEVINGYIVYTRVKKGSSNNNGIKLFENKIIKSSEEPKIDAIKPPIEEDFNNNRVVENVIDDNLVVGNVIEVSPVVETVIKGTRLNETVMEEKAGVEESPPVVKNVIGERQLEENVIEEKIVIEESPVVKNVIGERRLPIEEETVIEEGPVMVETVSEERSVAKTTVIEESQLVDIVVEESPLVKTVIEGSVVVETVNEESLVVETVIEEGQLVESEVGELSGSNLELFMCKDEPTSEREWLVAEEGDEGAMVVIAESNNVANTNLGEKTLRWFTRSVMKPKEELMDIVMSASAPVENEAISYLDGEATAEGTALTALKKNLELKMSKKIALNKKPTTVKELFETGLLEGVSVVYMGGSKASGLRGMIKDAGILCSCSYCKGCRVIPPSQFEIHACKQYRRASQYICFENGKSLLDVMKACRSSPLHTLEATLQSALSSLPEEKIFTCRRCKGSFPITCVGRIGPLCNSCVDSKKSEGSSNCATGIRARSPEPVLISKSSTSTSMCISSQNTGQWKITRMSLEPDLISKSPKSALDSVSSQNKRPWKRTRKSLKPDFTTKSSKSDSMHISSRNKTQWKITKKRTKPVLISRPFKSASVCISSQNKSQWKLTTKDQRLHKLVFEKGGLPNGTEVGYYARGQKLLEGYKKGFGIFCRCCNCEVSPSQFEAHAGWASRRKPYAYIYTSNGVSLHELAISLSKGRKYSAKDNDDLCIICADGGNLLLCDGCPRAFHKDCASLSSIPPGDWYCNYCQNMFEREKFVEHNANALAAGRVSGVDPIEQITKRCIRIVRNIEAELSGCVLCRAYDFSKSGFNPRTILLCDQCEKEYHVGCLKTYKMADLKELPKGKWFCCTDCSRIHSTLQKLLVRGAEKLPDHLLNAVKKKHEEKGLDTNNCIDVRWRLLSGKIASPETRLLLAQAVAIFHECFDPIIDTMSGRDLIPSMVYGRNSRGQEYGGMYCAILMVNSSVVSAGILRVFGRDVAELPLVATSKVNHGKGYFQLLFSCIEKLLAFLNVKSLVLPSAEEAESIWTDKFGFKKIKPDQLSKYRSSCCQMVTFKGTSMLQKMVPACRVLNRSTESTDSCGGVEQGNQFLG